MIFLIFLFVFFLPIHAWSLWKLLHRIPGMSKAKKLTSFIKSVFVIAEEGIVLSLLLQKAAEEVSTDPDGFSAIYIKVLATVEFIGDAIYWVPMAFGSYDEWFEETKGIASYMKKFWVYAYTTRFDPDWLTYIFSLNGLAALGTVFSVPIVIRSDDCGNDIGATIWIICIFILALISISLWIAGCCCDIMPKVISFGQSHTAKVLMIGKFLMVTLPVDISLYACSWEFPVIVTSSFLGHLFDYMLECGSSAGNNEDDVVESNTNVDDDEERNRGGEGGGGRDASSTDDQNGANERTGSKISFPLIMNNADERKNTKLYSVTTGEE